MLCMHSLFSEFILEEQYGLLEHQWQRHVSIGQAREEVQRMHWFHLFTWMLHLHRDRSNFRRPLSPTSRLNLGKSAEVVIQ